MVDVARALFLLAALVACVRARYAAGIASTAACALVLALEVFLVVRYPLRTEQAELAFGAVFLGPTALPHAAPFAGAELTTDPVHHVVSAAVAGLGAHGAFRRAALLPPDGGASRALDRAGLRLLAVAILAGLSSVSGLLAHLLLGGGE